MSNTPNLDLEKPAHGALNWDVPVNSNMDKIDAHVHSSVRRIAGSVATAVVVGTNSDTTLISAAIPAGQPQAGDLYILEAVGDLLSNGGTSSTFTWRVKFGTTEVLVTTTLSQTTSPTRSPWKLSVALWVESATAQRVGATLSRDSTPGTTSWVISDTGVTGYGTAAENTATGKNLIVSVQPSLSSANVDVRVHAFTLYRVAA